MKKSTLAFSLAVATLNTYYFIVWGIACGKYSSQADRVEFFLQKWPFVDSVGLLNISLVLISIVSLLLIHMRPLASGMFLYSLSAIHVIFLLAILWSSL